jgi:thiol-disulfide isomerase/thioredoxin
MRRRANALCPSFPLEGTSGEELYSLAELCQYQKTTLRKAQSAAEQYLAITEPARGPQARLLLSVLQMSIAGSWEASWETLRTILQMDPVGADQEIQIRAAIEDEADTNEAKALMWSKERYDLLLARARSPKPGIAAVSYQWVVMAGTDLIHRYYLAGNTQQVKALLVKLNDLRQAHSDEVLGWAFEGLNWADMEMKAAPPIPVLTALGTNVGPDVVRKGRVEVVSFFFLRCPPCLAELSELNDFQKRYAIDKVLVADVTTYIAALQPDMPAPAKVQSALNHTKRKKSPRLTMVVAPEQVLLDYKIRTFPVIVVIDKEGRLRYVGVTTSLDADEEIDRLVHRLLDE